MTAVEKYKFTTELRKCFIVPTIGSTPRSYDHGNFNPHERRFVISVPSHLAVALCAGSFPQHSAQDTVTAT